MYYYTKGNPGRESRTQLEAERNRRQKYFVRLSLGLGKYFQADFLQQRFSHSSPGECNVGYFGPIILTDRKASEDFPEKFRKNVTHAPSWLDGLHLKAS